METIDNKQNEKALSFQEFKSTIKELTDQEKTEGKTGHFRNLENVDELTEEDQRMWELMNTDWKEAWDKIAEYKNKIPNEKKSRVVFAAYLSNIIMRNINEFKKSVVDKNNHL